MCYSTHDFWLIWTDWLINSENQIHQSGNWIISAVAQKKDSFIITHVFWYLTSLFWTLVKASLYNFTHWSLSFIEIPAGLGSVMQFVRASVWMKESTVIQNNCVSRRILGLCTQFDCDHVYCCKLTFSRSSTGTTK